MEPTDEEKIQALKKTAVLYDNYQGKNIKFLDVFPIISEPKVLTYAIDLFEKKLQEIKYSKIFMLESRGFVFGVPLSLRVNKPIYPVRKKGKLPGEVISYAYDLQYGTDTIELQKSVINQGQEVIVIDDLLATGGTMNAAAALLKSCGAKISAFLFVIQITSLKGRQKIGNGNERIQVIYSM